MIMDTMTYGKIGEWLNAFDVPRPEKVWRRIEYADVRVELEDFPEDWAAMLAELLCLWSAKLPRNALKYRYYCGKNKLKDFGISTPPQLLTVETVVGWPQKAVDVLAARSRFDGFSAADLDVQSMLDAISERSRIPLKYRQSVQSELIHSCCFAVVREDRAGKARIDLYDAEHAAAVWDDASGQIAYGIIVDEVDAWRVRRCDMLLPDYIVHVYLGADGSTDWEAEPHAMGRAPMGAFSYTRQSSAPSASRASTAAS